MLMYKDYVKKTWWDFLKFKFTNFPTVSEARLWKNTRMGGGAMSPEEFQHYVEILGEENAIRVNKLRKMPLLQFYLDDWKKWFTSWSRKTYNESEFNSFEMKLDYEREYKITHSNEFDGKGEYIAPPPKVSEQDYWNMKE